MVGFQNPKRATFKASKNEGKEYEKSNNQILTYDKHSFLSKKFKKKLGKIIK